MSDSKNKTNKIFDFLLEQDSGFSLPNYGVVTGTGGGNTGKSNPSGSSGSTKGGTEELSPGAPKPTIRAPKEETEEETRERERNDAEDKTKRGDLSKVDWAAIKRLGRTQSGLEIGKFMIHREPPSANCTVDFESNAIWYFFAGGFMSWTLSPILKPFATVTAKSAIQIARTILMPWRAPGDFLRGYKSFISVAKGFPKGTRLAASAVKRSASLLNAILIAPGVNATAGVLNSLRTAAASPINTVFGRADKPGVVASTGNAAWSGIKAIKTLGYYACVIAIGYYIYRQTQTSKKALESSTAEKFKRGIQDAVEALVTADLIVEIIGEKGINLDPECSAENLIWGTVWFSLLGVGFGGQLGAAARRMKNGGGVSNYNDFQRAVRAERAFQYGNIESLVAKEFSKNIKGTVLKGLSASDRKTYYNLLSMGRSEDAFNFAKNQLAAVDPKAIQLAQNNLVNSLNSTHDKFWKAYRSQALKLKNDVAGETKAIKRKIKDTKKALQRQLERTRASIEDAAVPSSAFATLNSSKNIESVLRSASNSSLARNLDDFASVQKSLNSQLKSDQIGPLDAITVYERNYLAALNSVDNQIQSTLRGVSGFTPMSSISRNASENILKNLQALNQNDEFFETIIKNLGGKESFANAGRAKELIVSARNSQVRAKSILENQILRSNRKLTASDLKILSKELDNFNNKMAQAAGLKPGGLNLLEKTYVGVAITGASAAAIYHVMKLREEAEKISTWRSCNLARALVWSEFRPWPSRFDYNQEALKKIHQDTRYNSIMTRSIYVEHVYANLPAELLEFLDPGECTKGNNLKEYQNKLNNLTTNSDEVQNLVLEISDTFSDLSVIQNRIWDQWGLPKRSRVKDEERFQSRQHQAYFEKWIPIFIKIMIINSNFDERLINWINKNKSNPDLLCDEKARKESIQNEIWSFRERDMTNLQNNFRKCFSEEVKKLREKDVLDSAGQVQTNSDLNNQDVDALARMLVVETGMVPTYSPEACLSVALKRMSSKPNLTAKQIVGPKLRQQGLPVWNDSDKYEKRFNTANEGETAEIFKRAVNFVNNYKTISQQNQLINKFGNSTNFVHPNNMVNGKRVPKEIMQRIKGWNSGKWKAKMESFPMPSWIYNHLITKKRKTFSKEKPYESKDSPWRSAEEIPEFLFVPEGTSVLLTTEKYWLKKQKPSSTNEGVRTVMNNKLLKEIVKEMLNENYGKGYTPYPYHSEIGMEDEENPDFVQDWKDFEMSVCRDESKETAIKVAKILIKDLELFGDVIDLVGKNQSVATEILKKFRDSE